MPDVELDLERALAPLLERPLAEPEPMPELEWRAARVRRRRWATRLGVAAGAAAASVVAVTLLPNAADQSLRTTPPADAPPGPPAAPPPGPGYHPPRIADFDVAGERRYLLAGYDEEGNFCSGLESGDMGTFGCGNGEPLDPGEVLHAAAAQDTRLGRPGVVLPPWEPPFLYGMVAKDVATVRVELGGGGRAEVPVSAAEAGLPVNFYLVGLPPGADVEAVVALDARGSELGRLTPPFWWDAPLVCDQPLPDGSPCLPPGPPEPVSSVTEYRTHPPDGTG